MSVDAIKGIPPARRSAAFLGDSARAFFARSALPGFVGTALIALGAFRVGWVPATSALPDAPVAHVLNSPIPGTVAGAVALVAGIFLLVFAWLQVGQEIGRGPAGDLRRLWMTLAAWSAPLILAPPLFSRDVYSYVAQGRLMVAGLDPYANGPSALPGWARDGVDPMWADSPSPYGQLFLMLSGGAVELGGPNPYLIALLLRVLALGGIVLLAWAVPQLAAAHGVSPSRALWLGVLNPLVLMHFVSGAHNDALMIGLVAAGLALATRRQAMLGVVLVTMAGAVKPIGLVALPFVGMIWAGRGAPRSLVVRRWLTTAAVSSLVLIGFAVITGTGFGWLNAISTSSSVRTWLSPPTAVGMIVGSGLDLSGTDLVATTVAVSRVAAALLALVLIARLCWRPETRTPVRAAGLAFLVLVVLGPVVQPWYLLWSLPLLAATAMTRRETRLFIFGTVGLTAFSLVSHFLDGLGNL